MMNLAATPTNVTDGRQRLAGVMTSPFGTAGNMGGSLGNMADGMQTNNVTSPYSGATSGLPTGGSLGTVDPTGGGHLDGTTGMDYGSAGTGTGSSANQPADPTSPPLPTNISSQAEYEAYNHIAPSGQSSASGQSSDPTTVGNLGSYGMAMDPNAAKAAADAAYQRASEYFAPDFTRQQSDLENQLAAQGFTRGSEGYTRALDDMQRQQDLARTNAALGAQGVGFSQANQLVQNALATRAQDVAMRGQDRGVDSAGIGASATIGAANAGASSANYRADLDSELGLRGLGLQQDNQNFNQTMALMGGARGGVNTPNFGPAAPLDVGSAYGIASGNANSAANRAASDRNGLYQLGGSLLGSAINGYFGS